MLDKQHEYDTGKIFYLKHDNGDVESVVAREELLYMHKHGLTETASGYGKRLTTR